MSKEYRIIAIASIGHNARASNLKMTKEQGIYFDLIIQDLKKLLDEMYPTWETINLEVKEEVEVHMSKDTRHKDYACTSQNPCKECECDERDCLCPEIMKKEVEQS